MNTSSHPEIIGLGVSRDWLGIHCLTDSRQIRLPNADEGHSELESIVGDRNALVCFEAAGGCEWRLWASLEAAGIPARQLPPAQVKAFGRSRGTLAKTDRIDAELIACFMAFRPEAGRRLPSGKLRDLRTPATARRQLVEMRKNVQLQNKAGLKSGTADPVEDLVDGHLELTARQIAKIEERIRRLLETDSVLAETAAILRSVPIGPVVCAMLIAEMPELGQTAGEQAAALAGLAPIARDSGQMRGKRMIGGGRRALRQVLHQAALVASYHNKDLKVFADRLRKEGKPHKVVAAAV